MSLHTLPYDLLFNIAQYLTIEDIHHLQTTCKSLRAFTLTRPVYRALAHGLLARSRPLPLPAFQRLSDLSTQNLIKAVDRAHSFERAWRLRAPRPAKTPFSLSTSGTSSSEKPGQWYTKISAPPNEEIDWLSPITSSYTLCATKSGRVICWDVARDICLAEWDPRTLAAQRGSGEQVSKDSPKVDPPRPKNEDEDGDDLIEDADPDKKWELWKCRVEFDERAVYFTMARVLEGSYDDNRVMEFVLMKLAFPPDIRDYRSPVASPSSQPLSFSPDSQCCSLSKSPPTSPPPSSQGSSPQDSTLHSCSTSTEYGNPPRSLLLTRATSPTPDCIECHRDGPVWNPVSSCLASSHYPAFPGARYISSTSTTRASMRAGISFEAPSSQPMLEAKPIFSPLTSFHTTGVVMNVFLLDPPRRLLSAFVWVASSNTIGLYVLLDWAKDEYVFVDTGVGCLISSNWSCILHEDQIVIHSEEADAAYQHFYPLHVLRNFVKRRKPSLLAARIHHHDHHHEATDHDPPRTLCRDDLPVISIRLAPVRSISKKFVFPHTQSNPITTEAVAMDGVDDASADDDGSESDEEAQTGGGPSTVAVSVEKNGINGPRPSMDDERSEYETDDDDDDDSTWILDVVEDKTRVKGKGKARGHADDTLDEDEPGPSSRSKPKGKMKAVATGEDESEEESQGGSSSSTQRSSGTIHASSSSTSTTLSSLLVPPHPPVASISAATPAPNPYPFPPWYPESAHFVRQWWPSLAGVPRLSCTVVLLAAHDPDTHRTRFVLAQHYFRVPIIRDPPTSPPTLASSSSSSTRTSTDSDSDLEDDEMLHLWYVSTPFEVVCVLDGSGEHEEEDEASDRPRPLVAVDFGHAVWIEYAAEPGGVYGVDASRLMGHVLSDSDDEGEGEEDQEGEDQEGDQEGGEQDQEGELFGGMSVSDDGTVTVSVSVSVSTIGGLGVGMGNAGASGSGSSTATATSTSASTSTSTHPHEGDNTFLDPRRHRVPKCLRFVTFPPVFTALDRKRSGGEQPHWREEAVVRTLEIPEELDLDGVETINIDQSQGAVILSVKEGKIFILRYE